MSQAPSSASNQHRFPKMAVGRGRDSTQHPFPEVTYSIFTHTLSILSHMATFKVGKYILSGVGQEEYGKHLENSKYSLPCLQATISVFFLFFFFPLSGAFFLGICYAEPVQYIALLSHLFPLSTMFSRQDLALVF